MRLFLLSRSRNYGQRRTRGLGGKETAPPDGDCTFQLFGKGFITLFTQILLDFAFDIFVVVSEIIAKNTF